MCMFQRITYAAGILHRTLPLQRIYIDLLQLEKASQLYVDKAFFSLRANCPCVYVNEMYEMYVCKSDHQKAFGIVQNIFHFVYFFLSNLSCCCCFLSLLWIYSSFICVSWSFPFVCTMDEDYFGIASISIEYVFTMRVRVCVCCEQFSLPSYSILFTHMLYCIFNGSREQCAKDGLRNMLSCLLVLQFFCRLLHSNSSGFKRKLVQTVQFDSFRCVCEVGESSQQNIC